MHACMLHVGSQLDLKDFEIGIHMRYVLHDIISTGGECDSKLSDADLSATIAIGLSSDGHPTISASNVGVGVAKFDLGCSVRALIDNSSPLFGVLLDRLARVAPSICAVVAM